MTNITTNTKVNPNKHYKNKLLKHIPKYTHALDFQVTLYYSVSGNNTFLLGIDYVNL